MKDAELAGRGTFQISAVAESIIGEPEANGGTLGLTAELDLAERLALSWVHAKPRHPGELLMSEITEVEQINDN